MPENKRLAMLIKGSLPMIDLAHFHLPHLWQTRHRRLDGFLRVLEIFQLSGEITFVRGHVKVTMAGEVEE